MTTMGAADRLSDHDLADTRADLAAGKPVTVWFTSAAVGVAAGGSAKVVSVGEVAEGDFIQVRPAGSRDTMFCSPGELTRTRPARTRARPPAEPAPEPAAPRASTPQAPAVPVATRSAPVAVPEQQKGPERPQQQKAPERARPEVGRAPARPAEVTVVLSATTDGEWTVEVTVGRKRVVRPTLVQPADVGKAARSLPSPVAEAIEATLDAARERQRERVETLRQELQAAERALQELSG
jgi:hypothetical protein